jgi:acetoin utilization protein AcuB
MNVNTHPAEKWRVSGWMSRNVLTLKPKSPAVDAYELMHDHSIRHVPVVDHNKIVGIVSDRDLRPLIHPGRSTPTHKLFDTPVESIMSRKPICTTPDASIQEAGEIICREKIGALPVVEDGKLMGIVTTEDVLWALLENTREMEFED